MAMLGSPDEASEVLTMYIPPTESAEVTLAMLADMGRGTTDDSKTWHEYGTPSIYTSQVLGELASANKLDAAFLFGDLSYAVGYSSVWEEWLDQIEPLASAVPFQVSMGNHEYNSPFDTWPKDTLGNAYVPDRYGGGDSGGECGVPAKTLLGEVELFSGVTIGMVTVVSMNTEIDFDTGSDQWEFIKNQLAAVDRQQTPWVVLTGHRPGLIDSSYGSCDACHGGDNCTCTEGADPSDLGVMAALQREIGPLLEEYRVDLAFWGHNHVYQRHCAYNYATGECTMRSAPLEVNGSTIAVYEQPMCPPSPVHIVVGAAGADFTRNSNNASYSEVVLYEHGFVQLHAANSTFLEGKFIDVVHGSVVLDHFALVRQSGGKSCEAASPEEQEEDLFAGGSAAHVVFIFTVVILAVLAVVLVFYGVTFYFYDRPPKNHFMLREREYEEPRDLDLDQDHLEMQSNVLGSSFRSN
ncbi:hypothetical protein CYMTET_34770 [Cymbomonas tetramitiformis]|uniref:Calcineurin-like phosphoesterase domain-containing protein n=1 Tax=Cymbomonas tetramitiformis TaxID=36881 RepID=A0AAE0FAH6_9CHLO|nr:hypothetical protein CYMTET_34770 [Cymbomonas tetramitiformis]